MAAREAKELAEHARISEAAEKFEEAAQACATHSHSLAMRCRAAAARSEAGRKDEADVQLADEMLKLCDSLPLETAAACNAAGAALVDQGKALDGMKWLRSAIDIAAQYPVQSADQFASDDVPPEALDGESASERVCTLSCEKARAEMLIGQAIGDESAELWLATALDTQLQLALTHIDHARKAGFDAAGTAWAENASQLAGSFLAKAHLKDAARMFNSARAVLDRFQHARASDTSGHSTIADDVEKTWRLGTGKLLTARLRRGRLSKQKEVSQSQEEQQLVQNLFTCLLPEEVDPQEWQYAPLQGFDDVIATAQKAIARLQQSQEDYPLESDASIHAGVCIELADVYRSTAEFEESENRRATMQKRRGTVCEKPAEEINPNVCRDAWREAAREAADGYAKASEEKSAANKNHIEEARRAVWIYTRVIKDFEEASGSGEPVDGEHEAYISARLRRAHCLHRMASGSNAVQYEELALKDFQAVPEHVRKHNVQGFSEEMQLCNQMRDLVEARISHLKADAAR